MEALLIAAVVSLWIVVLVLAAVVLGLARQVGVLLERVAPAGALDTGRGLAPGQSVPPEPTWTRPLQLRALALAPIQPSPQDVARAPAAQLRDEQAPAACHRPRTLRSFGHQAARLAMESPPSPAWR